MKCNNYHFHLILGSWGFLTPNHRSLQNISRIGQASKLDKLVTTGRFGLGFNSVFHLTDLPSFVTGDHVVMFDPHEKYVPGSTGTARGLKIKFTGTDLIKNFPDQFQPYCHFGCNLTDNFDGTLFRFPLRNHTTASESEISKTVYLKKSLDEMITGMEDAIPKMLLFLRNVVQVELFVEVSGRQGHIFVIVVVVAATAASANYLV